MINMDLENVLKGMESNSPEQTKAKKLPEPAKSEFKFKSTEKTKTQATVKSITPSHFRSNARKF
jgi:hypothetical protein